MNYKEILKNINTLIFDYDGVLTDGTVLTTEVGEQYRTGYVRDGYALHLALKKGYNVAIISGGTSHSISKRLETLNLKDIYICVSDKVGTFNEYLEQKNIDPAQVLFMGDDIPDYKVMQMAGLPACPADAAEEIKSISKYISPFKGGHGCVRDIIEQLMKIQGTWMNDDAFEW
ncbi:MAG TPA: HAD-IIIA family hydrolase [Bacteroidales bacterium]|nr:HAD-IIIA family hydrolase [Bacteroidales bacterium]